MPTLEITGFAVSASENLPTKVKFPEFERLLGKILAKKIIPMMAEVNFDTTPLKQVAPVTL